MEILKFNMPLSRGKNKKARVTRGELPENSFKHYDLNFEVGFNDDWHWERFNELIYRKWQPTKWLCRETCQELGFCGR